MSIQQSINQVLGTSATIASIASQPHIAAKKREEAKAREQEAMKSELLRGQNVISGKTKMVAQAADKAIKEFNKAGEADPNKFKKTIDKIITATETHQTELRKQIESAEKAYIKGLEEIDGQPTLKYIEGLRKNEAQAAKKFEKGYKKLYATLERAMQAKQEVDAAKETKNVIDNQQRSYMEELKKIGVPESVIMKEEVIEQLR